MADVKGKNRTIIEERKYLDPGTWNARVKVSFDEYEAAGLEAASTITMMTIPKGAKIVGGKVYFDALGTGTAIDVGIAGTSRFPGDPYKYLNGEVTESPGSADIGDVDTLFKTLEDDETLIVTTTGATTGTIKLMVMYVLE